MLLYNHGFRDIVRCIETWRKTCVKAFLHEDFFNGWLNEPSKVENLHNFISLLPHTAKMGYSSSPAEGIKGLIGSELPSTNGFACLSWLRGSSGFESAMVGSIVFASGAVLRFISILVGVPLEASCHIREPLKPCQCIGPVLLPGGPPSLAGCP